MRGDSCIQLIIDTIVSNHNQHLRLIFVLEEFEQLRSISFFTRNEYSHHIFNGHDVIELKETDPQ
jgi:hypothetical protein